MFGYYHAAVKNVPKQDKNNSVECYLFVRYIIMFQKLDLLNKTS